MIIISRLHTILYDLVLVVMLLLALLLLLRLLINYTNVNPFSRWVMTVRQWSDPMVEPMRRTLMQFGVGYRIAPLLCVLVVLLLGYIALGFLDSLFTAVINILSAVRAKNNYAAIGFLIYGLLAFYSSLLILRIIVSWGRVSFTNRGFRWLAKMTDPLLVPLRRRIPPIGMFDISPLVAFFAIWILQQIVVATFLRGAIVG